MIQTLTINKSLYMKKLFLLSLFSVLAVMVFAQSNVLPAPPQKGVMVVKNATIHIGNGTVVENGTIIVRDGKIEKVGANLTAPSDATVVDAKGQHIYPGLILPVSQLGLIENGAVRASNDSREIGDMNPNVRS